MRLYRPVQARLSLYVHAMVSEREEAREILSETCLTAYERFETVKDPESFIYFLFTIAKRKYKRGVWRRKIFRAYDASLHEPVDHGNPSPETQTDLRLLHDALAKLPSKQREAVTLFELSDLPLEEIAKIQNSKLSAVKQRVRRGRFKLADRLGASTTDYEDKQLRKVKEIMNGVQVEADGEDQ
jgi:RNA polymerase sigma-70 factor, ECF subfamily